MIWKTTAKEMIFQKVFNCGEE